MLLLYLLIFILVLLLTDYLPLWLTAVLLTIAGGMVSAEYARIRDEAFHGDREEYYRNR